jgi:ketosteroid isomerase-like protein
MKNSVSIYINYLPIPIPINRRRIKMRVLHLFLLIFIVVMCACAQEFDTTADIEAQKKLTEKWDEFVTNGDFDAMLNLYVDNPIRMHQHEPILIGKDAIRTSFQTFREQNDVNVENKVADVIITGEYAVVRGTFSGYLIPKQTGKKVQIEGKGVSLRQRQTDGSWKIVYDIWNSDFPETVEE